MTKLEIKTLEAFHQMWDNWDNPTPQSVQDSINTWAEAGKGFGSGLTEIWKKKEDFSAYIHQAMNQDDNGFSVQTKWLETDHLSDEIVAIWGEITITINMPSKNILIDPIRITGVYKLFGNDMKLVQWHASEPDVSSEEEIWPGTGVPKIYTAVSVLFSDFVNFTNTVANITPQQLISELNELFAAFDVICRKNGLDKIKTIGDAYMAAGGLKGQKDHAPQTVRTAKEMLAFLKQRNKHNMLRWDMRIGIHSGSVVGGVIGSDKLSFDLWGNTVNLANRMESMGAANKINLSDATYQLVKQDYKGEYRGKIKIKDGRKMDMYFVL